MGHYKEIIDMEQVDLFQEAGVLYHKHEWYEENQWVISKPAGEYSDFDSWMPWSKWAGGKDRHRVRFAIYVEED